MRAVDEMADLRRLGRHLHVLRGDVLEQRDEVDLLLVVAAQAHSGLLADDRQHRLVVELRVVEAVQQVDRARAGGGYADADFAGELRVAAGHEGSHLLVADLDELWVAARAVEGAEEGVDAVAGVAVDPVDAPLGQPFEHVVSDEFRHLGTSLLPAPRFPGPCPSGAETIFRTTR